MGVDFEKLAEAFGLKQENFKHIRLGPGVVGNTSSVAIAAMAAIAFCSFALKTDPHTLLLVIGLVILAFVIYVLGTWIYAHLHPDHALMASADLLDLHKMEMAAQHPEIMLNTTLSSASSPPQISSQEAGK